MYSAASKTFGVLREMICLGDKNQFVKYYFEEILWDGVRPT